MDTCLSLYCVIFCFSIIIIASPRPNPVLSCPPPIIKHGYQGFEITNLIMSTPCLTFFTGSRTLSGSSLQPPSVHTSLPDPASCSCPPFLPLRPNTLGSHQAGPLGIGGGKSYLSALAFSVCSPCLDLFSLSPQDPANPTPLHIPSPA